MNQGNTNLGFLGNSYQFKLLYNLIWYPKFSKHILPFLASSYFEDYNYKKMFVMIKNYHEKYGTIPDKHKIEQLIQLNVELELDQEMLTAVLDRLVLFSAALIDGTVQNDSEFIQETAETFVEQQKLQQVCTFLQTAIDNGDHQKARQTQELLQEAFRVTEKRVPGVRMGTFNATIVKKQYFDAIPTGIPHLDEIIGGLPRGKVGMFVAGQGVGKSSFLTLIANNAYLAGKRVLHVVFDENEVEEVERLHTARWAGIPTKHFPRYQDFVERKYKEIHEQYQVGELIIERLSSDGTTVFDLKTFILAKQQELGFEFDMVVIDYLEELSAVNAYKNAWDAESEVMRSIKSLAVDLNICLWTATQGTKTVNDERWVLFKDIGGSVMKIKKSQLIVSGGVALAQRKTSEVNFALLKCNYAASGHQWEGCHFNRSILDLQFSEVGGYMDNDELKKGYDEEDEHEMMLLLTSKERDRLPEIDKMLAEDEEQAPEFVPLVAKKKMVGVIREQRRESDEIVAQNQLVDNLKKLVDDTDLDGL